MTNEDDYKKVIDNLAALEAIFNAAKQGLVSGTSGLPLSKNQKQAMRLLAEVADKIYTFRWDSQ